MNETKPLKMEPSLFEWAGFTPDRIPVWFTNEELQAAGFNIHTDYTPLMNHSDMQMQINESVDAFYDRNHQSMLHLINQTGEIYSVVL